tara:strand:- start:43 stop:195 length:153 start_codon:yes stop_codon:yes gene_type:complete
VSKKGGRLLSKEEFSAKIFLSEELFSSEELFLSHQRSGETVKRKVNTSSH